jgi:MYXO-CTERM domain-containing protein
MTIARYVVAGVLILVGLVWIGQGVGMIGGSSMSGQGIFAILGAALLVVGAALAWQTRRTSPR